MNEWMNEQLIIVILSKTKSQDIFRVETLPTFLYNAPKCIFLFWYRVQLDVMWHKRIIWIHCRPHNSVKNGRYFAFRRVHRMANIDYKLRHVCPSAWKNSDPTTDFHEIWYLSIFENLPRKFKSLWNVTRITGTLQEHQYTFFIISRSVLLEMRNVSDKRCRENQNTHFLFIFFFRKSCRLWDNVEKYCRAVQARDDNQITCALLTGYLRL
jgi:hypothetical protein